MHLPQKICLTPLSFLIQHEIMMDLDSQRLRQQLSQAALLPEVLVLKKTTASTNLDVREIAQSGANSILVSSEIQSQGRGQHQRAWASPQGNVYMSCLLQTQRPLDGRLALETALNILQMPSLQNLEQLQVKWPNDLYHIQGKWGGILVEPLDTQRAIIGVGINLHAFSTAQLHEQNIDQPVCSLSQLGLQSLDRILLISELYQAIQQAGHWFNHGCTHLAQRFNHYAAFIDQPVVLQQDQQTLFGIFRGIDDQGCLNIETVNGLQTCYHGRLRLQNNTDASQ